MSVCKSIPLDYDSPPAQLHLASYRQNYLSISNLGNGSFGSVELAKYRAHQTKLLRVRPSNKGTMLDPLCDCQPNPSNLVAIKTMKKRLVMLNDYMRVKEVKFILSIPSHPCLVQIYDMFIDDINFQLHISMEPMSQNLYQLMKARKASHFSPVTLKSILSQILLAIRHIHRYNYFHRDVKPENILVVPTLHYYGSKEAIPPSRRMDNFVVKLADYGLARHIHNLKPYTAYVSTRWYRSPEILLRQRWYSRPIDIWAFGAVAAEVANFMPLFPGSNELDQIWRVLKIMGSPCPTSHVATQGPDLKTPYPSLSLEYESVPLGGYWPEAQILAEKLGFVLPDEPGLTISDIMKNPQHIELGHVVKACLTWDPQARPTVEQICAMPYFQNFPAGSPYIEPARHSDVVRTLSQETRQSMAFVDTNQRCTTKMLLVLRSTIDNSSIAMRAGATGFDDDDGYEQEFIKENGLAESCIEGHVSLNAAQRLNDPVRLMKESIDPIPHAGVYRKVTNLINMCQVRHVNEIDLSKHYNADLRTSVKRGYASDTNSAHIASQDGEVSSQIKAQEESSYSWDTRKENQDLTAVALPEIQRVNETLEEEYSLIGDISFGSVQEINVN